MESIVNPDVIFEGGCVNDPFPKIKTHFKSHQTKTEHLTALHFETLLSHQLRLLQFKTLSRCQIDHSKFFHLTSSFETKMRLTTYTA